MSSYVTGYETSRLLFNYTSWVSPRDGPNPKDDPLPPSPAPALPDFSELRFLHVAPALSSGGQEGCLSTAARQVLRFFSHTEESTGSYINSELAL